MLSRSRLKPKILCERWGLKVFITKTYALVRIPKATFPGFRDGEMVVAWQRKGWLASDGHSMGATEEWERQNRGWKRVGF